MGTVTKLADFALEQSNKASTQQKRNHAWVVYLYNADYDIQKAAYDYLKGQGLPHDSEAVAAFIAQNNVDLTKING